MKRSCDLYALKFFFILAFINFPYSKRFFLCERRWVGESWWTMGLTPAWRSVGTPDFQVAIHYVTRVGLAGQQRSHIIKVLNYLQFFFLTFWKKIKVFPSKLRHWSAFRARKLTEFQKLSFSFFFSSLFPALFRSCFVVAVVDQHHLFSNFSFSFFFVKF